MRSCVAAVAALLWLITGCSTSSQPSENYTHSQPTSSPYTLKSGGIRPQLQESVGVQHANLAFSFDFENQQLFGEATLILTSEIAHSSLSVDLDKVFNIDEIRVNGEQIPANQYTNNEGQLIVTPSHPVSFPVALTISYHGHPRTPINAPWDGGVMWEETATGKPWLATAVQGEGCDLFWPCIDHPQGEPLRADIYVTLPNDLVAASNGVLVKATQIGNQVEYHWQTRSAHNTYGIALNVAPYETLSTQYQSHYGNRYPIVYYYLPGDEEKAQQLFAEIPLMLQFFEQMIGPYPFATEKVGVVETPHLGMEHQTINGYGNKYKKDEFGFDWLLHHEFSHEYFGNQITNDNWDHMWLHEGLGSYMQPLFAQYLHGDLAYMAYLNNQRKRLLNAHPIVANKILAVEQVYEAATGPALDIYMKGSWIIHTLRGLLGDDAFFKAIRHLVYGTPTPTPGNFTTLYRNTQEFIDLVNGYANRDLNWFFNVYVYQARLPELLNNRSHNTLTLTWIVPDDLPFPMPVDVSVNGKITTLDMTENTTLAISPDDVIIIDPHSKILRYEARYQPLEN